MSAVVFPLMRHIMSYNYLFSENTLKCIRHFSSCILGFGIPQPAIVKNLIELIQTLRIPVVVCGTSILGSTILLFPKALQSADLIV